MVDAADNELERLRASRRSEIQQQLEAQADAQAEAEIEAQTQNSKLSALDDAMRSILTPDARSRLATLSLVDAETTTQVKTYLSQLANTGRISIPVEDDQLKRILAGLKSDQRETTIRRM
jgi:programmed cell death protein 5